MTKKIGVKMTAGFVGLGKMGHNMVSRLVIKGHR